jgi:hypothetical protein
MEEKEDLGVPARGPIHRNRMEKATAWGLASGYQLVSEQTVRKQ